VSGKLHVQGCFTSEEKALRWMVVSQNQSGHFGEGENALPMPQIKL